MPKKKKIRHRKIIEVIDDPDELLLKLSKLRGGRFTIVIPDKKKYNRRIKHKYQGNI